MKKVLIAVDETEESKAILSVVQNIVRPPESIVLLLVQHLGNSIIDTFGKTGILPESSEVTGHKEAPDCRSERILNFYRRELEDGGLISVKMVIRDGVPSEEILKVAQEEGVDVVITRYNGRGGTMRNQKGEVVTGVMVVIMVVMMLFGGMHMMHGGRDHQHGDDHDKRNHKHDQQKEGMHHMMHNDEGEHSDGHEEAK